MYRYDITIKRPCVLLIGNGLVLNSSINSINVKKWDEYIYSLSDKEIYETEKKKYGNIPYSILASLLASDDDVKRHNDYLKCFETQELMFESSLEKIVTLPVDAILTTNYTYEIENVFCKMFSNLKDKSKFSYYYSSKADGKYLLHHYNKFPNSPEIWHIHGELRRKSSIILTHDEYVKLIGKLVEENNKNSNKYVSFKNQLKINSWLDYFIVGNLYIVGFSMNFSELDLWWILNRRKREKGPCGEVHFFATKDNSDELVLSLENFGVIVHKYDDVFGKNINNGDSTAYYDKLYSRIFEDLKRILNIFN